MIFMSGLFCGIVLCMAIFVVVCLIGGDDDHRY